MTKTCLAVWATWQLHCRRCPAARWRPTPGDPTNLPLQLDSLCLQHAVTWEVYNSVTSIRRLLCSKKHTAGLAGWLAAPWTCCPATAERGLPPPHQPRIARPPPANAQHKPIAPSHTSHDQDHATSKLAVLEVLGRACGGRLVPAPQDAHAHSSPRQRGGAGTGIHRPCSTLQLPSPSSSGATMVHAPPSAAGQHLQPDEGQ